LNVRPIPCLCILALLLTAGCGGNAQATKQPTPRPTAHTAVQIDTPTPVVPTPSPVPTVTLTPTPVPTPTPTVWPTATAVPVIAPVLVYASLRPDTVPPGGSLTAYVQTQGTVRNVQMYLGSGATTGFSPVTIDMSRTGAGTWGATVTAPDQSGTYHFTVALFGPRGGRNVLDNDGWNVTVSGGSTASTGGAQAPPADILYAPPFSYGNPVAATFTAEGQSINGSEIISNSLPGVSAETIGNWYDTRLPRAGWTVQTGAIPAGATSFTIVATEGSQVCVVQFASGTVSIYYGTL